MLQPWAHHCRPCEGRRLSTAHAQAPPDKEAESEATFMTSRESMSMTFMNSLAAMSRSQFVGPKP